MNHGTPVGILGGVFDPVHNGHLAVARLAMDYFGLPEVFFVPAGTPPHKHATHSTALHRLSMLKAALRGVRGCTVWDGELRRGGSSYTIDTLRIFGKRHPGSPLYFIIGSDNLVEISSWRDYTTLMETAVFCVAHRPGHSLRVPRALSGLRMKVFPSPEWGISSSTIREYLSRGYSCAHLLPAAALRYIRAHGLYKGISQ
jgi:nicotinate-nucleotide adenylyltransferase